MSLAQSEQSCTRKAETVRSFVTQRLDEILYGDIQL